MAEYHGFMALGAICVVAAVGLGGALTARTVATKCLRWLSRRRPPAEAEALPDDLWRTIALRACGGALVLDETGQVLLSHPESPDPPRHHALAALRPGERTVLRDEAPDGTPRWTELACHAVPGTTMRLVLAADATARTEAERQLTEARARLETLATQDGLTGLPNRVWFLRRLDARLRAGAELAVLCLDLDRFRQVNEVHGHAIGDEILREVTRRLAHLAAADRVVARLGADEFAIMIDGPADDSASAALARDIIRALTRPVRVGHTMLDLSVTLGIAASPRDGVAAETLLRSAGMAMTHARRLGGSTYRFFEQRMRQELAQTADLMTELPGAIAAGEIVPWFQPLVRLSDNRIVGFEVLARWAHPMQGILPPARFLPLVAEAGLSSAMFESILADACRVAREWPQAVGLSVNISAAELRDDSLPDAVSAILDRHGVAGARVEVEITENALIHDAGVARAVLERLRGLGLRVALDDFGTGFSSLYHLRELPFDKIKIDKSFMRALATDGDSARYVAAIIGLGQALGLEVTGEGIEDQAVMQRLRELGCTYGQGYLFGRPMPAADATRLLEGDVPAAATVAA